MTSMYKEVKDGTGAMAIAKINLLFSYPLLKLCLK